MARRYSRDNRGRFAGAGGGATARGGRLKTAAGNKRQTQKRIMFSPESKRLSGVSLDAAAKSGKINMPVRFGGEGAGYKTPRGKAAAAAATAANNAKRAEIRRAGLPKSGGAMRVKGGLKRDPGAAAKLASRAKPAAAARRPDMAEVNIKGRFTGQAGKRFDASIDRAVKQVKASERARLMKPKAQVKAERAARAEANRQAAAAKPKRVRSAESQRMSRAKQVEKRRSITTNPAGERAPAAAKMAANASRTQQRAAAFYKTGGKAAGAKPARAAAKPKTGQEVMKANVRKVQNQKLRKINAQIKEAGPNAAGLRLQKLQLQSNMTSTRPKRTPRQEAKEQASVAAAKGRVATMRRVNRARANKDRTADTRNIPGSAMKRRPSQKTTRANNLADRALSFYSNPAKALQTVKKSRRGFRLPRGMR
jgi:hypothetical protein